MNFNPTAVFSPARAVLLCLIGVSAPALVSASPLCEAVEGRRILRIQPPQAGVAQHCDLQGLEKLPAMEVVTALPLAMGMKGTHRWKGVPLRVLVERLGGGKQSQIRLTALNDYAIQIPWSDIERYDPILAYHLDGKPMGVRDKGPLILIYPFDSHRSLQSQEYLNRTIWQVNAISVR
jgi:hypothetical protein